MKLDIIGTKYAIHGTNAFKRQLKKIKKQGKDLKKLNTVLKLLANNEKLPERYNNHLLIDSKEYYNCYECHIEPNWLLIYTYINNELIILVTATGSHSDLF